MRFPHSEDTGDLPDPDDAAQPILDCILSDLDGGKTPDPRALKRRFPGREALVDQLCLATSSYAAQADALRDDEAREQQSSKLLEAKSTLGDFVTEAPLGRGGMGCVYRAKQRSLGNRVVALKVLPASEADPAQRESFKREAQAASSLHHPHLAEVYGFGTTEDLYFYAMRLVEGPTLAQVLERLAEEPPAARDAFLRRRLVRRIAEVCGALAVVHRAGLVHRDVKPGNIMLEAQPDADGDLANESAVLVDFGLVQPIDPELDRLWGRTSATPAYAAPEILRGEDVDARADVFSLGVTLHDLLCARLPHRRLHASAGFEPLHELIPAIDIDLSAVVAKATDPSPEWRYADAAALQADLEAWLAGNGVSARPRGRIESAFFWVRRHPWRALRATAAVAAIIAVTIGVSWGLGLKERVRNAHKAIQEGNIPELARTLEDMPSMALDENLRKLASGMTRPAYELVDPLSDIMRVYLESRENGATIRAAEYLERHGVAAHRILGNFLRFRIRKYLDGGEDIPPDSLYHPITAVARVFIERPDLSPEDTAASAPFRELMLQILADEAADQDDALYALTALAGCGTPANIHDLIDWMEREWSLRNDLTKEQRRLQLWAVERILRRAQSCGTADQIAGEPAEVLLERLVAAHGLSNFPRNFSFEGSQRDAWNGLLRALAFFERARGRTLSLKEAPVDLLNANEDTCIRAIVREPEVAAGVSARIRNLSLTEDFNDLGWMCGALDDGILTARAREAVAAISPLDPRGEGASLLRFESGLERAHKESLGIREAYDHDEDSHLGYERYDAMETLPCKPVGRSAEGVIADWDFTGDAVLCGGLAQGAKARLIRRVPHDSASVLVVMPVFGHSELSLEFTLPVEAAQEDLLKVGIEHLRATRVYMPMRGVAALQIRVDGTTVHHSKGVHDSGMHEDAFFIPRELVQPGKHTLSFRLVDATTTYRISRVWIEGDFEWEPEAPRPERLTVEGEPLEAALGE